MTHSSGGKRASNDGCNDRYDALRRLAFDLGIRWSGVNEDIWMRLNPDVWQMTHNPCLVLNAVSREKIDEHLADDTFAVQLQRIIDQHQKHLAAPTWFTTLPDASAIGQIAYFSMEYMLSESLPLYSGGLGNVAGDQLKAASDLGVPVIAVGMLWQHGYFRQEIDSAGRQHALFPVNDTAQMPIEPLLRPDGSLLRLAIDLPGLTVWLRGWQVRIGRSRLLLLDSNDPINPVPVRLITEQLYGGDAEMRLRQEIVLGIGGWRLLEAAGHHPRICHLNDGHAAFVALERARNYMCVHSVDFQVALTATRAGNLFTTHTPVSEGFDCFEPALIGKYLRRYIEQELEQPLQNIISMGQAPGGAPDSAFNTAWFALRCSGAVNAVSQLHAQTSRRLFQPLFPRVPTDEVPIGHIVNGIHIPTWMSTDVQERWQSTRGEQHPWSVSIPADIGRLLGEVDDGLLWQLRQQARAVLVAFVRQQLARSEAVRGESLSVIECAGAGLHPEVLTLGFARRFAPYKRPNLLLADPDRLLRLLNHPARPVQLLIAGKAHPANQVGQEMIRQWHQFIRRPEARGRVAFIEDYDMRIARHLVQGVDVWINTPRRPWEACGTSGMKVLANGGLNLSQLDGWWAQAYAADLGWALGDAQEHSAEHDTADAEQLYLLLEKQVIPAFYDRGGDGRPAGWIKRMRASMGTLVAQYSADRTVREYVEHYYAPMARAYVARSGHDSALARNLVARYADLVKHWPGLSIDDPVFAQGEAGYDIRVMVKLGGVDASLIQVQVYRSAQSSEPWKTWNLTPVAGPGSASAVCYTGAIAEAYPVDFYTVRIVLKREAEMDACVAVPWILWQK